MLDVSTLRGSAHGTGRKKEISDAQLTEKIRDLGDRVSYRRPHILLARDVHRPNHKTLFRLYRGNASEDVGVVGSARGRRWRCHRG